MKEIGSLQLGGWKLTFFGDPESAKDAVSVRISEDATYGTRESLMLNASKTQTLAFASLLQAAAETPLER